MAGLAGDTNFPAVGFDDCFGNSQAHACALDVHPLTSAAIEFFEYQ